MKAHVTRLYVGLNRQASPRNARCKRQPRAYEPSTLDDFFDHVRRQQGIAKPGATRFAAKGLWKGRRERTSVFEVQWFPGGSESYQAFRRNMVTLARRIATRFCQDSVLVVHRSPRGKAAQFVSPRATRPTRKTRP